MIAICLRTASVDPDALGIILECETLGFHCMVISPDVEITNRILRSLNLSHIEILGRGGFNSSSKVSEHPWRLLARSLGAKVLVSEERLACRFIKFVRMVLPGSRPVAELSDGCVYKRPIHLRPHNKWLYVAKHKVQGFFLTSHFIANSILEGAAYLGKDPSALRSRLVILQYPRFRIYSQDVVRKGHGYILLAPTKEKEHRSYNENKLLWPVIFSEAFREFASKNGLTIAFRSHVVEQPGRTWGRHSSPVVKVQDKGASRPSWVVDANDGEAFPTLAHAIAECSLFITDYSSAYVDALAAEKPVLFVGQELPKDRLAGAAIWPGPRVTEESQLLYWANHLVNGSAWELERNVGRELMVGENTGKLFVSELLGVTSSSQSGLSKVRHKAFAKFRSYGLRWRLLGT